MFIAIIGLLLLIISTLVWNNINWMILSIGVILFDASLEICVMNDNIRVMVRNINIWSEGIIKAIKEEKNKLVEK